MPLFGKTVQINDNAGDALHYEAITKRAIVRPGHVFPPFVELFPVHREFVSFAIGFIREQNWTQRWRGLWSQPSESGGRGLRVGHYLAKGRLNHHVLRNLFAHVRNFKHYFHGQSIFFISPNVMQATRDLYPWSICMFECQGSGISAALGSFGGFFCFRKPIAHVVGLSVHGFPLSIRQPEQASSEPSDRVYQSWKKFAPQATGGALIALGIWLISRDRRWWSLGGIVLFAVGLAFIGVGL